MNAYRKLAEVFVVIGLLLTQMQPAMVKAAPLPPPVAPIPGEVYSVYLRSTLYGIQQAILGKPGTAILTKDGAYLFVWQIEDGFAFAGVRAKQAMTNLSDIMNGNYVSAKTMRELVEYFKVGGWCALQKGDAPAYLKKALTKAAAGAGWLRNLSNTLPTFLIFVVPGVVPAQFAPKVKG